MQIADDPCPPDLHLPLQQHPFFVAALSRLGREARLLVLRDGSRTLGHVVMLRRPGLGRAALAARGPVWTDAAGPEDRVAGLRALNRLGLRMVEAEGAGAAPALRAAGFRQVTTPAHLAVLDLAGTPAGRRARASDKWRNRMRQAEAAGLHLHHEPFGGDPGHWLLRAEAAQRRARRYRALPTALAAAFAQANPGMARLFLAEAGGAPVAAMLFLRHGPVATYHIGWTGPEGRRVSAHGALLMLAADWLAERGHVSIELGCVDTEAGAGLARFKLGAGARLRALGGGWLRLPFL